MLDKISASGVLVLYFSVPSILSKKKEEKDLEEWESSQQMEWLAGMSTDKIPLGPWKDNGGLAFPRGLNGAPRWPMLSTGGIPPTRLVEGEKQDKTKLKLV